MKYDIQIVLPVSGKKPYEQRLKDFKKWGVANVQNKRVLVTLLCGTEKIKNALEGWPDGVDVETVEFKLDHLTLKTYNYFHQYTKEMANKTRWIAKIDDDSINDISNWVDNLDKEYDHEGEFYIVTELRNDTKKEELNILDEMGYHHWIRNIKQNVHHEWEGSVLSSVAIRKIINNSDASEFIQKRSLVPSGVTDVGLAYAARMAKIYPSSAYFMSPQAHFCSHSILGGDLNHIHFMSRDRGESYNKFLYLVEGNATNDELKIRNKVTDKQFVFGKKTKPLGMFTLDNSGQIIGSKHKNETLWKIKNNKIQFISSKGVITCEFEYKEEEKMIGKSSIHKTELYLCKLI